MQALRREVQNTVPYVLSTERTAVAGNAAVVFVLQIPGDADFEARYITGSFTSVTATMQISDAGTRQFLFNRPTMVQMVAGTGLQPYVIPCPALFVRNSNIQVDFTDLSGSTNTIQINIHGMLLYPGPINRG